MLSTTVVYALASIAQRALAFVLLPIYTRYLTPAAYGALELLNALFSILFALLVVGLPSAVVKCYHRDCEGPEQRARVLWTGLALDLPILLGGCAVLWAVAEPLGRSLIGLPEGGSWIRLVAANAAVSSLLAIVLAHFRAQERATAFAAVSAFQFCAAFGLNVLLLVRFEQGITGVLWGNLLSSLLAVPLALLWASGRARPGFDRELAKPLLRFGLLLVPSAVASWTTNLSDRWVLRFFGELDQVAVYAVGYKVAMVLQLVVVWPFQLSWPNVAFSIADEEGHRATFTRAFTYLALVLAAGSVGLSSVAPLLLPFVAGDDYRGAHQVVPLVTLGYLLNGLFYCASPGVHLAQRTSSFPALTAGAAATNLALNFALVPYFGILGAAAATTAAFGILAAATVGLAERHYRVGYEYRRLAKLAVATVAALVPVQALGPAPTLRASAVAAATSWLLFVGGLVALRFARPGELRELAVQLRLVAGRPARQRSGA